MAGMPLGVELSIVYRKQVTDSKNPRTACLALDRLVRISPKLGRSRREKMSTHGRAELQIDNCMNRPCALIMATTQVYVH